MHKVKPGVRAFVPSRSPRPFPFLSRAQGIWLPAGRCSEGSSRQLPKGRSFWGENAKDPRNSTHSVLTAMPACRVPSVCVAVGARPLRKDDFAVIRGGALLAEPRCHAWRPRELIDNKFSLTHDLESLAYLRLHFKKLPGTAAGTGACCCIPSCLLSLPGTASLSDTQAGARLPLVPHSRCFVNSPQFASGLVKNTTHEHRNHQI